MKPTNDDLARLIPEAKVEYERDPVIRQEPDAFANRAIASLQSALLSMSEPVVDWAWVRHCALHALYLCALIAWEAGRRMAPAWHINRGDRLEPVEALSPVDITAAETPVARAKAEILEYLRRFVGTGGGVSWKDVLDNVGRGETLRPAMRELVADGLVSQSDDPITLYAPTSKAWPGPPAAKGVDVDALLREADAWRFGLSARNGRTYNDMIHDLAAALRAERGRANTWQKAGEANDAHAHKALDLLSAVLDWGWPDGTTGPEPVRRAQAFLRGEEQATRHDDAREAMLRETELVLRCEARESRVAVDKDLHPADIARELGRQLRSLRHDLSLARAQLATEDEAVTHLRTAANDALAAQNRAESEAATLRIEVVDLRRKVAEGEALVDHLVAWAKKGRA